MGGGYVLQPKLYPYGSQKPKVDTCHILQDPRAGIVFILPGLKCHFFKVWTGEPMRKAFMGNVEAQNPMSVLNIPFKTFMLTVAHWRWACATLIIDGLRYREAMLSGSRAVLILGLVLRAVSRRRWYCIMIDHSWRKKTFTLNPKPKGGLILKLEFR